MDRFSDMLLSRLRVVVESAANDIEQWAKVMGTQIDDQLRERRQSLQQRRDAHSRIRAAEDGLEFSIQDLEARESRTQRQIENLAKVVDKLRILAASPPPAVDLDLEEETDEYPAPSTNAGDFAEADLADQQTKAAHVVPRADPQPVRSRRAKPPAKPAPAHGTA
jgi:septal ring factor EnvC (AmiA/AmiB activator)